MSITFEKETSKGGMEQGEELILCLILLMCSNVQHIACVLSG